MLACRGFYATVNITARAMHERAKPKGLQHKTYCVHCTTKDDIFQVVIIFYFYFKIYV